MSYGKVGNIRNNLKSHKCRYTSFRLKYFLFDQAGVFAGSLSRVLRRWYLQNDLHERGCLTAKLVLGGEEKNFCALPVTDLWSMCSHLMLTPSYSSSG